MHDEVPYGVTSIYRRFIEIQGSPPAFTGQVTVAQKYIVHSFAPIGLVARQRNESGFLRHVRDDPDGTAAALAGFLLSAKADRGSPCNGCSARRRRRGAPSGHRSAGSA